MGCRGRKAGKSGSWPRCSTAPPRMCMCACAGGRVSVHTGGWVAWVLGRGREGGRLGRERGRFFAVFGEFVRGSPPQAPRGELAHFFKNPGACRVRSKGGVAVGDKHTAGDNKQHGVHRVLPVPPGNQSCRLFDHEVVGICRRTRRGSAVSSLLTKRQTRGHRPVLTYVVQIPARLPSPRPAPSTN
jgi:hypothetical protein